MAIVRRRIHRRPPPNFSVSTLIIAKSDMRVRVFAARRLAEAVVGRDQEEREGAAVQCVDEQCGPLDVEHDVRAAHPFPPRAALGEALAVARRRRTGCVTFLLVKGGTPYAPCQS